MNVGGFNPSRNIAILCVSKRQSRRDILAKIAIFGDSFAAIQHRENSNILDGFVKKIYKICNRPYNQNEYASLRTAWGERCKSWSTYLDADNYAFSGSDLYYSYNQFINNQYKYEKCIFVITSPNRYSTNINGWTHCPSLECAEEGVLFASDENTKQSFKILKDFFTHIYYKDFDRTELIHQALLDSIILKRPDTLFIDAFPYLTPVYEMELSTWKLSRAESQDYTRYFDLRHNHMTNENNKILADVIQENINTVGYLDLSKVKWKTPTLDEKDYYLPKTRNIFNLLAKS